jgi:hypothetical protein
VSRIFLRVLFSVWLCWFLAGPVFETFDFWDSSQEEMLDIASSICGALIWAAASVCLAIRLLRELHKRCSHLSAFGLKELTPLKLSLPTDSSAEESRFILASPPLRI